MFIGLLIVIISGSCFGVCFFPVRYMNKFAWENIWFVYSLLALVLFPILVGWATIPGMVGLYREVGWRLNLIVLAAGLLGGASVVMYGQALIRVGMAVVNALGNGVSLVLGAFIPLIIQHRNAMRGRLGLSLSVGVVLAVAGLVICCQAAGQRDQASAYMDAEQQKASSHVRGVIVGLLLAVGFGVLQIIMNLGLAFADDYMKIAKAHGTSDMFTANAFYIPSLVPTMFTSVIYFAFLWKRNRTLAQFRGPNLLRYCLWCVLIAVIWFLGMLLYGWAMTWMRGYGPIVGWPVFMVAITVCSAVLEYFYGDWRGRALRTLNVGLGALTISVAVFAYANMLIQAAA